MAALERGFRSAAEWRILRSINSSDRGGWHGRQEPEGNGEVQQAEGNREERAPGGLRTLRVAVDGSVLYTRGIQRTDGSDAVVYMIDPEMHYVAASEDVALLELGT